MSAPKRIQMTRQRPWRADNPDAVRVDRATKWGNPFAVEVLGRDHEARIDGMRFWVEDGLGVEFFRKRHHAAEYAVECFRSDLIAGRLVQMADLEPLRGLDLACWCPPSEPCHADVLLELANALRPTSSENT